MVDPRSVGPSVAPAPIVRTPVGGVHGAVPTGAAPIAVPRGAGLSSPVVVTGGTTETPFAVTPSMQPPASGFAASAADALAHTNAAVTRSAVEHAVASVSGSRGMFVIAAVIACCAGCARTESSPDGAAQMESARTMVQQAVDQNMMGHLTAVDATAGLAQLQKLHLDQPADAETARTTILGMYRGAETPEYAGLITHVVLNRYLLDTNLTGPQKRAIESTVRMGWRDVVARWEQLTGHAQQEALAAGSVDGLLREGAKRFLIAGIVYAATPFSEKTGALVQAIVKERRAMITLFATNYAWALPRVKDEPARQRMAHEQESLRWMTQEDSLVILGTINDPRYGVAMGKTLDMMIEQFLGMARGRGEIFWGHASPFDSLGNMSLFLGLFLIAPLLRRRIKRRQLRKQLRLLDRAVSEAESALHDARAQSDDSRPGTTPADLQKVIARYEAAVLARRAATGEAIRVTMLLVESEATRAADALVALLSQAEAGNHPTKNDINVAVDRLITLRKTQLGDVAVEKATRPRFRALARNMLTRALGTKKTWKNRGAATAFYLGTTATLMGITAGVATWIDMDNPAYVPLYHAGMSAVSASDTGEALHQIRTAVEQEAP